MLKVRAIRNCITFLLSASSFKLSATVNEGTMLRNTTNSEPHKVIIIGAGASGVAAACELLKSGFTDFIILEASDRIGGRIHTTNFGDNIIENGAQFVDGEEGNIIYEMASPYDLLIPYGRFKQNTTFINNSGKYEESQVVLQLIGKANNLLTNIDSSAASGSLKDYFVPRYHELVTALDVEKKLADRVMELVMNIYNHNKGFESFDVVGTSALSEYVICKGPQAISWKDEGFKKLFDLLTLAFPDSEKELPVKHKILYNKVVSSVTWGVNNVDVLCEDGVHYYADHVIVTSSLGFLKSHYHTFFTPCLPLKKQTAIEALGFSIVDKIHLLFPYRWWPEEVKNFNFLWTGDEKNDFAQCLDTGRWVTDITGFFFVENQPRMLCAWVHGNAAKEMEKSSDETVITSTYNLLNKFLGKHFVIPKPEAVARSHWYSDNYSLGSYSYRTLVSDNENVSSIDLAEPILDDAKKLRVLFAGEATHPGYFSSTHGAVETGIREAKRILDYLSSK